MTDDAAWSAWFSFQYDLREDVTALIQERTKGRSDAFKTAVYSALIETLVELRAPAHHPARPATDRRGRSIRWLNEEKRFSA